MSAPGPTGDTATGAALQPLSLVVRALWSSSGSIMCQAPCRAPGELLVSVTNNGADFSAEQLHFSCATPPAVTSISPAIGSVRGGTLVTVLGRAFSGRSTYCRFGAVRVLAIALDSSTLKCVAPPHAPGPAVFAVSDNEYDFTPPSDNTSSTFTYELEDRRKLSASQLASSSGVYGGYTGTSAGTHARWFNASAPAMVLSAVVRTVLSLPGRYPRLKQMRVALAASRPSTAEARAQRSQR